MNAERLQLAFGGLQPDRLAGLVEDLGSESAVVAAIASRRVRVPEAARAAVLVPATVRADSLRTGSIAWLDRNDPGFPGLLAGREDAPPGLFVRGEMPAAPGVAVVGTRKCTAYGKRLASSYGRAIAAAGWPLVSGLARGIDGAAHRGTVAAGGVGVAVLGSGLDALYPREHSALASELVEGGGAVVSEYPPDATPFGWRFPPRNRIISGLCRAVVVVEAGVKGGALITARLALDQGVSVFAVPGDIDRDSSRGCNLLIRDGAHPVLDSDDLIDELELVVGPRRKAPPPDELAPDPLLDIVARTGEVSVDAVASQMQLPISEVLVRVVGLEASGRVTFDGLMLRANGH